MKIPRLYNMQPDERLRAVFELAGLGADDAQALRTGGLDIPTADMLVENVIGLFALPLGIATNFRINGRSRIIAMVTEEPSVIAAASAGAKAACDLRASGSASRVVGQIQVINPGQDAVQRLESSKNKIISCVRDHLSSRMSVSGGGASKDDARRNNSDGDSDDSDVTFKMLDDAMLKVEFLVETGDAMGANAVNTACEAVAPLIQEIAGGTVLLRILSNHMQRMGYASSYFDVKPHVAANIVEAYRFAALDVSRAVTHNKGIMNGVSAVGMATGQDTRALEAGAHAYAASMPLSSPEMPQDQLRASHPLGEGVSTYLPLSRWEIRDGRLYGSIAVPLAVGTVGGLTTHHPVAAACLRMLGSPTARELAGIMAAVGLCQNFSALRALATDGIQKGHMKLHNRRIQ